MHTSQFDAGADEPALLPKPLALISLVPIAGFWLDDCDIFTDSKSSKAVGADSALMPVLVGSTELYPEAPLPDKYSVPCARAEAEDPIDIISARFAISSPAGSKASSNGQHMHKHETQRDLTILLAAWTG